MRAIWIHQVTREMKIGELDFSDATLLLIKSSNFFSAYRIEIAANWDFFAWIEGDV